MGLNEIRQAMVARLQPSFPGLKTVESHGGRFTERELPLLLNKAPGLLIATLSMSRFNPRGRGEHDATLAFVGYCLATDTSDDKRIDLAEDIAEQLARLLPGQNWGLPQGDCKPPTDIAAQNLYSGQINIVRIALWTVTWNQMFVLK